jgi:hypothetical protein
VSGCRGLYPHHDQDLHVTTPYATDLKDLLFISARLNMDDSLEQPNVDLSKALLSESGLPLEKDDEGQSSGDEEDGGLDWTKLSQVLLRQTFDNA